ncbi:MAG TPA: type I-C CRISPR-associated protein Cas5c [Thermoanaerobaculia bacterium]|nr:type I-C CRISPR-associated protein Cas5c [Thermoanaerobaculia bacterium]
MAYGIRLRVWGDFAAFNRPEMKVERVSYEVITPSAARGILEAIYWKPQMQWIVDRLHVLRPIRFSYVRRNEIDNRIPIKGATGVAAAMKSGFGTLGMAVEEHRQQRAAMVLRDVCYGIEAHVEVLDPTDAGGKALETPEGKHLDMFRRRATSGQFFHHPYLGVREFLASFELVDEFPVCPDELRGERDLGLMLHDIRFSPDAKGALIEAHLGRRVTAEPRFFHATLRDGIIEVPPTDEWGSEQ